MRNDARGGAPRSVRQFDLTEKEAAASSGHHTAVDQGGLHVLFRVEQNEIGGDAGLDMAGRAAGIVGWGEVGIQCSVAFELLGRTEDVPVEGAASSGGAHSVAASTATPTAARRFRPVRCLPFVSIVVTSVVELPSGSNSGTNKHADRQYCAPWTRRNATYWTRSADACGPSGRVAAPRPTSWRSPSAGARRGGVHGRARAGPRRAGRRRGAGARRCGVPGRLRPRDQRRCRRRSDRVTTRTARRS